MLTTDIFIFVFSFICVYIFLYVLLGIFFQDSSHEEFQKTLSRSLDIFMAIVVLTIGLTLFFSLPVFGKDTSDISQTLQDQIYTFLKDPWSLLVVGIVIVVLYLIIYLFRIPMTPSAKPFTIILLENGSWILLAILVIENFVRTFLNIDLVDRFVQLLDDIFMLNPDEQDEIPDDTVQELDTPSPSNPQSSVVISDTLPPQTPPQTPYQSTTTPENDKKEVFNISGNKFTYGDAPAICASYGAELATYDQIEESYKNGGEWCNYGWSKDQMAFFPTQKDTWKKMQSNPSTANQCGRPGVNGGYMSNPNITFGVNCYGVKPSITENDKKSMQDTQTILTQPLPLTPEEIEFNQKLQYWKENAAKSLTINGFNEKKWSEF